MVLHEDWGIQPLLHMLDKKCSAVLKNPIPYADTQHQLFPPGLHHAFIAEQEIQTFKHHLIDGLSSCDLKLPLHLWCRLIQQTVLTLNILFPEKLNSRL